MTTSIQLIVLQPVTGVLTSQLPLIFKEAASMRFPYIISVCIFVSLICVTYLAGVSFSADLTDSVQLNDVYE
jgi:cytochrome b subunit of formate dehydrogenase